MINVAVIPAIPFTPHCTRIKLVTINVISVIPDTGFEPTVAIALAATVVNKNDMISTTARAIQVNINTFGLP